VERVLQAALIERGDLQLNFEDVHLHDVIEHAVHNIAVQVEALVASNETEADLLRAPDATARLGRAIAEGVRRFFEDRGGIGGVRASSLASKLHLGIFNGSGQPKRAAGHGVAVSATGANPRF